MSASTGEERPCGRCGRPWNFHDVPWGPKCAGWKEPAADPMDQPLDIVLPIFCMGETGGPKRCTKLWCPGPVPITPRQIVAQAHKLGWGARQSADSPTSWRFTCETHT